MSDLFKWKGEGKRKEKKCENDVLDYYQKRTSRVAEEAVRCVTGIDLKNRSSLLHDDVYEEAQQVVRGWITEQKIYGPYNDRDSFLRLSSEETVCHPSKIEVHKEWEHLINKLQSKEDYRDEIKDLTEGETNNMIEDKRLRAVMKNLQSKSFVKKSQLRLIDSPKQIDVVKKMESRQEQVKKKREERLKNEELERMNKLAEKEARTEAVKMLKEEKNLKELAKKREEELIQADMLRIRAEIQKQKEEENKEREKVRKSQRNQTRKDISLTSNIASSQDSKNNPKKMIEDRFKIISQIVEKRFVNKKLTVLRRCFQVWRDEVEMQRMKMEQAVVWNSWQTVRKVFRVWRRDSRLTAINRKIEMDQQRIRLRQKKEEMAKIFWKRIILKKCLLHWSLYIVDEKETKWFLKLEDMRKQKMAKYIDVLQEKAMENQKKLNLLSLENNQEVQESEDTIPYEITIESDRGHLYPAKVSEIKPRHSSARSVSKSLQVPREAWQVRKKHVNLPIEKLLDNPEKNIVESVNSKSARPTKVVNNYANRNAVQKEMIEQQRLKLKEQERIINELVNGQVLNKVSEETSRSYMSENSCNNRLLPSDENIDDINKDNEMRKTIPKKVNKIVLQMEERAKEREKIKNDRLDRQRKQEEEKRNQLAEQLAEQCRIDAEEKHKREKLLKEKREKDRLLEQIKRKNAEIEYEKNKKADQFYKSMLLKNYGMKYWKKLIEIKKERSKLANMYYKKKIMRKTFVYWSQDVNQQRQYHKDMITAFSRKVLLKRYFNSFILLKKGVLTLEQNACDHYLKSLKKRAFLSWRLLNHRSQIRLDKLEIISGNLYERNLMKSFFYAWKQLPAASRAEREREKRKETMRRKVAAIIPDFKNGYSEKI